jgi:glycerol-3-phosphate dehydrogenase subunit B
MEADVIVIGGGMAGAAAALRAAERGADVILIRKGFGATAMSSGTIDIAGPAGFLPRDPWDSLPSLTERLTAILRENPLHPYSILAGDGDTVERLTSALSQACEFVFNKLSDLRFRGSVERNIAIANGSGTAKFCAFAPISLAGGDLATMRDAHLLIAGIHALPFFRPHICRQALMKYCSMHPPSAISRIDTIEVDFSRFTGTLPRTPFEIAQLFDEPNTVAEFAGELNRKLEPGVTHVGVPPVLGTNNHAEAYEILSSELRPRLFELISRDFAAPGHRLQLSLDKALENSSVRTFTAEVTGVKTTGRKIEALTFEDMRKERTASAKNYVLASGKFSSGGLVAKDFLKEPMFRLPLFFEDACVDKRLVQELLCPNIDGRHPFLSCGIHIDASLRPLDRFDTPVSENLFAAGSIIGEYNYVTDKCGFGVAILTGYRAGENASE